MKMNEEKQQGDLISRKYLKEQISELWSHDDAIDIWIKRFDVEDLIDNAPPAEPEKVLIANVTFDEDKLKEIVQTEIIDKIKSGELVLKAERPQGEWVRKLDVIHQLERWSDGYSYIEIPTEDAIKAIKEMRGDA